MLAMQTANEYGLLDSVCAPYHHCAVCYHQQSSSSSSSSSCSWSWSSQGFSNRWVLDGGAPDTTIPSSRPWSWSASSKICVFYSHNNSLFLCQDHGHCQRDKWWGSSSQSSTILVLLGMKFFSSKLLEFFKSVTAVLSLSSTHLHKFQSSKSSKMCVSLLACLVIAAASFTSW